MCAVDSGHMIRACTICVCLCGVCTHAAAVVYDSTTEHDCTMPLFQYTHSLPIQVLYYVQYNIINFILSESECRRRC